MGSSRQVRGAAAFRADRRSGSQEAVARSRPFAQKTRALLHVLLLVFIASLVLTAGASPQTTTAGSTSDYVYDELGRLVTVVRPDGAMARYQYDTVGNIVTIKREVAPAHGVIDFSPRRAAPGARVTILGRGFETSSAANKVSFNGIAATVVEADPSRLTVRVPPKTTAGPIRVVTTAGSFSSPRPFRLPPPGPSITSFTPAVVDPGGQITLSGQNFQPLPIENIVTFNGVFGSVASAASISLLAVPPTDVVNG